MSDVDYEELFRSPLDDPNPESKPGWAPVGAGVLIGVGAALLTVVLWGGDETGEVSTEVPGSSAALPVTAPAELLQYPPGYQEFVPGLGIRAQEIIAEDDVVTVAFSTVVERSADPLAQTWPLGGKWWLESADDSGAESERVVLGRFSPGAFSVEFPADAFPDASAFSAASMIERWDHPQLAGSADLPFSDDPYVLPEPLVVPISATASLIIEELELGRFLGKAAWRIEGEDDPRARVTISAVLQDAAGSRIGSYEAFPELLEPATGGVLEILWAEPFPTSQEGATSVVLEYDVGIIEPVPAELIVDLTQVPVSR